MSTMPTFPHFYVTEVLPSLPGEEEMLREEITKLVQPSRAEQGCISYELFEDVVKAGTFVVQMEWRHESDYVSHNETAHIKGFVEKFENKLYETPQIVEYRCRRIA